MEIEPLHSWSQTPKEAVQIQKELASTINLETNPTPFRIAAACDVSFNIGAETLFAAIVVVDITSLEVLESATAIKLTKFPYVPGLLSFRELPVLVDAFSKLRIIPDVIVCDGQGVAHPRRMGIATHLGLWLRVPTVGCAKNLLCGKISELGSEKGSQCPIMFKSQLIGYALRTKLKVKPLYISPGHLCSFEQANALIFNLLRKNRQPEPIRLAHNLANEARRNNGIKNV